MNTADHGDFFIKNLKIFPDSARCIFRVDGVHVPVRLRA